MIELSGHQERKGRIVVASKLYELGEGFDPDSDDVFLVYRTLCNRGRIGDAQLYLEWARLDSSYNDPFLVHRLQVLDDIDGSGGGSRPEANIKMDVYGRTIHTVAEGNGPVDAAANVMKRAISEQAPEIARVNLVGYTIPGISGDGTDAGIEVVASFRNDGKEWDSIGNGTDVVATSAHVMLDAYRFFLLRERGKD